MKSSRFISRFTVFALTVSILTVQTMVVLAVPSSSAGELTVTGQKINGEKPFVMVNGDKAFTGRAVFAGGTVATTDSTSATISLGKVGRIDLAPSTVLTLSFDDNSITGVLQSGNVNVANSDGVTVKIDTPNDVITNEASGASAFTVTAGAETSKVLAKSGVVRYNHGASVAQKDDDDDGYNKGIWVPVVIIGGAVGIILLMSALNDDDDEIATPIF